MTYQPTKKELEEMMFKSNRDYWYRKVWHIEHTIKCYPDYDEWRLIVQGDNDWDRSLDINIYPQSKSDIECLIRMFNPNK